MRLSVVESGHSPEAKEQIAEIEARLGHVDDVDRTLLYRPELFGGPFNAAMQAVMRGPSDWSVGERELFAAFVSAQNQCPFWREFHGAVASQALDRELVAAVLNDCETAPVAPHLRAVLRFLRKLTLRPREVAAADVQALRKAGVSDAAIADAVHVCALFDLINRVADSLGVEYLTPEKFERGAALLFAEGY